MRSKITRRLTDLELQKLEDRHRGVPRQGSHFLYSRIAEMTIPNPLQIPVSVYDFGTDPSGGTGGNPAQAANSPGQNNRGKFFVLPGYSAAPGTPEALPDGRAYTAGDFLYRTRGYGRMVMYTLATPILVQFASGRVQIAVYGSAITNKAIAGSGRIQIVMYGNYATAGNKLAGRSQIVMYGSASPTFLKSGSGRAQIVMYGNQSSGVGTIPASGRAQIVMYGSSRVVGASKAQIVMYGSGVARIIYQGAGRIQIVMYGRRYTNIVPIDGTG